MIKHLEPIDFVERWLLMTKYHPAEGHYLNAVACRKNRPEGLTKDDPSSRCSVCDAIDLMIAHGRELP